DNENNALELTVDERRSVTTTAAESTTENAQPKFQEITELCERHWKQFADQAASPPTLQPRVNSACQKLAASLVEVDIDIDGEVNASTERTEQERFAQQGTSFDAWRQWVAKTLQGRQVTTTQISPTDITDGEDDLQQRSGLGAL